jgi:hypothetical protein
MLDELHARYRRVLDVDGPPGARIEETVDAWLDFAAERPALIRIALRELGDGVSEHSRRFADRAVPVVRALADVIAAGQADG